MIRYLKVIKQKITLEPVLFLYAIAGEIFYKSVERIALERACRVDLNLNTTYCKFLDTFFLTEPWRRELVEVYEFVAVQIPWNSFTLSTLSTFVSILLCIFSDLYKKRKLFIMIPLVVLLISINAYAICIIFLPSLEVLAIILNICNPLIPKEGLFVALCSAYIIDTTGGKNKTLRIGIATTCFGIGIPVSTMMVIVMENTTFWDLVGALLCVIVALVYTIYQIREPGSRQNQQISLRLDCSLFRQLWRSTKEAIKDVSSLSETMTFIFVAGVVVMTMNMVNGGENAVTQDYVFIDLQWNKSKYDMLQILTQLTAFMTFPIFIFVLKNVFKITDMMLMALSFPLKVMRNVFFMFAYKWQILYFFAWFTLAPQLLYVMIYSMAATTFGQKNLGKVQVLLAIRDILESYVSSYIDYFYYVELYQKNHDQFPGFFFVPGLCLSVLYFPLILLIHYRNKRKNLVMVIRVKPFNDFETVNSIQFQHTTARIEYLE